MRNEEYFGKDVSLLDRVRACARLRRLARRTEIAYVGWIERFIRHVRALPGNGSIPPRCPTNTSINSLPILPSIAPLPPVRRIKPSQL